MNPELGMLKSVLTSSYDGLPYHLKSPFLYLSIFPEDHGIRLTRLVRRWISEGYSVETRNRSAEDSGTSNITELINRNMVRPSKGTSHRSGRVGFLQVHDLIREVGVLKAEEENLVFTLENGVKYNTHGRIRHLAVSSSWTRDRKAFESAVDLSHIRSLTVFGRLESFLISDKMRLLRVLDLEDATGLTDHHLSQIGEFVHLSYLSLRGCFRVLCLPNSIGNLTQLHTLDVRDTKIIKLPRAIVRIQKLQYLRVGFVPEDDYGQERGHSWPVKRCCCTTICCFPCALLAFLVVLFYIIGSFLWIFTRYGIDWRGFSRVFKESHPQGVKLPRGVQKLKALHTMGIVNIDGEKTIIEDLVHLTQLRKLRVTGLNKKNCKAFFSAIANHSCLESLMVREKGDPGLSGILDGESCSPPLVNLQSLKLYGNLGKLPQWVQGLENLVKMDLRSSSISGVATTLEILGKLQRLAILRLRRNSFLGEEVCLNFLGDTFMTLLELEMDLPSNITSVGFEKGAMPVLKQLSFNFLDYSTAVFSGLNSLISLKELVLSGEQYNDVEGLRAQLHLNQNHPVLKRE